ncbi:hypothetical protein CMV_027213 [Castanea mollissima]|uniref:Uncharacterized protein n=1 Tax=Castanea mollissima TaxID=60419 RepID=A0A8J4V2Y9_9ROSI|nr:hypothetical protein CMV_027213 [Castanea mollissima]
MSLDLPSSSILLNQFQEISMDLLLSNNDCCESLKAKVTNVTCFVVVVSTNGFRRVESIDPYVDGGSEHLFLHAVSLRQWSVSNPSEQNDVKITVEIEYDDIESSFDDDDDISPDDYDENTCSDDDDDDDDDDDTFDDDDDTCSDDDDDDTCSDDDDDDTFDDDDDDDDDTSSDDPKITWLGVHVDCICCPQNIAHFAHHPSGCGSSLIPDDHSFASDVGLQMGTTNGFDLHLGHQGLGFTYGLDDLGSSSTNWICDNTELQPLPAVFSPSYGTDLDHGVLNSGGVSGLLIEPNSGLTGSYLGFEGFESTFHGDVHDLDSSSFAYPFASTGYLDSNASRDGCPPLVLDEIEHHSLPSDMFDSYLGLDSTVHSNGYDLGLTSIANPFLSIGYNHSDAGEHCPPSVPEDTTHHSLPSDLLPVAECDGFDLGAFDNNDSDFNQFPPSKKARTS